MRLRVEEFWAFDVQQESPCLCILCHDAHSELHKLLQDLVIGNGDPGFPSLRCQEYYRKEDNFILTQNSAKKLKFLRRTANLLVNIL
jgi:hypothetical protein